MFDNSQILRPVRPVTLAYIWSYRLSLHCTVVYFQWHCIIQICSFHRNSLNNAVIVNCHTIPRLGDRFQKTQPTRDRKKLRRLRHDETDTLSGNICRITRYRVAATPMSRHICSSVLTMFGADNVLALRPYVGPIVIQCHRDHRSPTVSITIIALNPFSEESRFPLSKASGMVLVWRSHGERCNQ